MKFTLNFRNDEHCFHLEHTETLRKLENCKEVYTMYNLINKADNLLYVLEAGTLHKGLDGDELQIWLPFNQVKNYQALAEELSSRHQHKLPRVEDAEVKEISPGWTIDAYVLLVDIDTVELLADLYDG